MVVEVLNENLEAADLIQFTTLLQCGRLKTYIYLLDDKKYRKLRFENSSGRVYRVLYCVLEMLIIIKSIFLTLFFVMFDIVGFIKMCIMCYHD